MSSKNKINNLPMSRQILTHSKNFVKFNYLIMQKIINKKFLQCIKLKLTQEILFCKMNINNKISQIFLAVINFNKANYNKFLKKMKARINILMHPQQAFEQKAQSDHNSHRKIVKLF